MIQPIEEVDKEFSELLIWVINNPMAVIQNGKIYHNTDSGLEIINYEIMPGRNDSCICGSGKKFKKML